MSQTVLVTGGAGYIGSQTNLALLEAGYKTIVFDNLVYGHQSVVPVESEFFLGDLNNPDSLEEVFSKYKIDAVVHFAAYAYVGESVENPAKYYQNNVVGTLNLLNAMKKHGVNKIVFSSTCAIYGEIKEIPVSESKSADPISPYGKSKWMVEQILDDFSQAYDLNAIKLRYFNACGADKELRTGEWHDPETHLIPIVLEVAAGKREILSVFGDDYDTPDKTCIRDYIHTMDLASGHVKALQKLFVATEKICEGVNLATGKGYSILEIVDAARKTTGKEIKIEFKPRRAGDPAKIVADNAKAKAYLGWDSEFSDIDFIMQTAWDWMLKNTPAP